MTTYKNREVYKLSHKILLTLRERYKRRCINCQKYFAVYDEVGDRSDYCPKCIMDDTQKGHNSKFNIAAKIKEEIYQEIYDIKNYKYA